MKQNRLDFWTRVMSISSVAMSSFALGMNVSRLIMRLKYGA